MNKNFIIQSVAALFLCCSVVSVQAETVQTLTWQDCIRETLENNPELVSAVAELEQAGADKTVARSAMLPSVSTELSAGTSKSGGQERAELYSYSVSGQQLLFDGFKTSQDLKGADAGVKVSEYNYAVTSANIRLDLRRSFAELLKAQELVALTESILERRKQNLKLVQLRYEAGREHKGALLTAEADLANAAFEVEQAQRYLSLAQLQLMKSMGREAQELIAVEGDFSVFNHDSNKPDFQKIADTTPLLKELAALKDAAKFSLNSEKAGFFPEVYLSSSAGRSGSDWPPDGQDWGMGVRVSWSLFEGGSRTAKVSKAEAKLKQAQADERSGRDSIILTLQETWTDFMDALGYVSVQKKFLEATEERAKIADAQYSAGLITFDDWIIIEDNQVSSKKAFLDAQANLLIAEAKWIQAKGGTLDYD